MTQVLKSSRGNLCWSTVGLKLCASPETILLLKKVLIILAVCSFDGWLLADDSDPDSVVSLVISSHEHNNAMLGNIIANLRKEMTVPFGSSKPPADVEKKASDTKGSGRKGTLQLVRPSDGSGKMVIEWLAELGTGAQYYEIDSALGRMWLCIEGGNVTEYQANIKRAFTSPWSAERFQGTLQYDPREIGFLSFGERLGDLLKTAQIKSANIIARDGDSIAVIKAYSDLFHRPVVIECSSRFGFLPTRIYYLLKEDGEVDAVTDIVYQLVANDPQPAWFLKEATSRHAFPHKNLSPDYREWGQTITTVVKNVQVHVPSLPKRNCKEDYPKDTVITDLTNAQPLGPNQEGLHYYFRIALIWLTVLVIVVLLGIKIFFRRS